MHAPMHWCTLSHPGADDHVDLAVVGACGRVCGLQSEQWAAGGNTH